MENFILKRLSDEDFEELLKLFLSGEDNFLKIRSSITHSYINPFEYENEWFNPFKFSEKQGKKIVDSCIKVGQISKLISFFISPNYLIKVPYSVIEYYFNSMLKLDLTDTQKYFMLHYDQATYFDNILYKEKKRSEVLHKVYAEFKDKLEFSDKEALKEYVTHLTSLGLQYRDYDNSCIFNNYISSLEKMFYGGSVLNAEHFILNDNMEEYLKNDK